MTRQVWSFGLVAVAACLIIAFSTRTQGQSCTFTVSPTSISSSAASSVGFLTVAANDGSCTWSASSGGAWVSAQALYGYAARVIADGAAVYWRLDEATASTRLTDVTGHGITGHI